MINDVWQAFVANPVGFWFVILIVCGIPLGALLCTPRKGERR